MQPLKVKLSWALYDFAVSAYNVIILTFVFAAYFVKEVAENEIQGSTEWGFTISSAAFVVAVISPIIGAAADQGGKRKFWLGLFTLISVVATCFLWFIKPSPSYVPLALLLVGIATIGAESSYLFYNAMLPDIAENNQVGRWSGWGWSFGYIGGIIALLITLFLTSHHFPIQIIFLFAGCWYGLFSLPLFLFTPDTVDQGKTILQAIKDGLRQIWRTLREIKKHASLVRFFAASMLYLDGLATIFTFGGIYAGVVYHMNEQKILLFGLALNISAGIGACLFAFIDDWIGAKKTIICSLINLIIFTILILVTHSEMQFWIFGLLLGLFVGPVQASTRSYLARMAPEKLRHQMFGFSLLSGKATSFLGPLSIGTLVLETESLKLGFSSVIYFFLLGLILIITVSKDK